MSSDDRNDITQLLISISDGDQQAYNKLFPLVYDELRNIAQHQLFNEYSEHTLSKTELVHEIFLKLIDQSRINFNNRSHFYAIAARCMRQLLVDYARKKNAEKRGGGQKELSLDDKNLHIYKHAEQILDLDTHLDVLSKLDERLAKLVELRFFAGLSIEHTAEILQISVSTANREWVKARAWLYQQIKI